MGNNPDKVTTLKIPYPPTINHYYGQRVVTPKNGGRPYVGKYIGAAGKNYRDSLVTKMRLAKVEKVLGMIQMWIGVHPPDHRGRDLDNILKCVWDALEEGGLYENDSQISTFRMDRLPIMPGGLVVIKVRPAPLILQMEF